MTTSDFELEVSVSLGDDHQYSEIRRRETDRTAPHSYAVLLVQCLNALAETRNSRDLDRIAEAASREMHAIFEEDRKAKP